jgi:hypothetical protein
VIYDNTVFILGAGASVPYGYPTGKELREYICSHFKERFGEIEETNVSYTNRFSDTFKKSSTGSIDLFLSRNTQFSEIGR